MTRSTTSADPLAADPLAALALAGLAALEQAKPTASRAPFAQYAADILGFARVVLGIEPWGRWEGMPAEEASQVDVLLAIQDHDWVAMKSGHKVGKSLDDAIAALWWPLTRDMGRVTITAPANHQVDQILWTEVRLLHRGEHPGQKDRGRRPHLPGHLYEDPRSGLKLADGWGIVGLTTDTAERMSGKSGAAQLFIVDEASGYPEEIMQAIFGNLAGGGKALLTGNPSQLSGTFFRAFKAESAGRWKTLSVSSLSTPNFHGGHVAGLADRAWAEWALGEWGGPGNAIYDVRVLGRFPEQGDNAVVALSLVLAAQARWNETEEAHELDLGVDVAREGDDETIIAPRRGKKALPLEAVKIDPSNPLPPGHQVGEAIALAARRLSRPADTRKPRIKIDSIGVGCSVCDYLAAHYSRDFEIVPVNSATTADTWLEVVPALNGKPAQTGADTYRNLRSQIGFGVATWLRDGGAIPPDDSRLEAELAATRFFFADRGRLAIEEKSSIKKRLRRSPDRADALALACYEGEPRVRILPPARVKDPSSLPRYGRHESRTGGDSGNLRRW